MEHSTSWSAGSFFGVSRLSICRVLKNKVRLDELIDVLKKLFIEKNYDKSNIVFMEYILSTILEHGRLEHMNDVFDACKECRIPVGMSMRQYYFKCVDKEE